jgi:peptide-methionine (S)-S-oxide reductase
MMTTACARNTAAVKEVPAPAKDLPPSTQPSASATIVLAGGCFWCTEGVFEHVKGVTDVVSGYAGGTRETATYEQVSAGNTRHAESIKITYDPSQISYGQILRIFFTVFDPTTKDAQGPDHGHQYRSAIFYQSPEQKQVAEAYIKQLDEAKVFNAPIVTTLEPLTEFYPAEKYHQDYVKKNPDVPYVKQQSLPDIKEFREKFPNEYKDWK